MSNIIEDLKTAAAYMATQTGYRSRQFMCTGNTLIEMYRSGALDPNDTSLDILIPGPDRQKVMDYLENEHGKGK